MSKLPMPFKDPYTYPNHSGIDFPQNEGVSIYASGPGVINYSGYLNERAGYGITMSYDQYPGVEFMYAHYPKNGRRPAARSRVEYGSHIGVVGQTGSRVTGPHVHLEVTIGKGAHDDDGVWIYFDKARYVGDGSTSNVGKDDEVLNKDDKEWLRAVVREEIGAALSAFNDPYAEHAASKPLNEGTKDWSREMVRQEVGGALSAFAEPLAKSVADELDK